MLKVKVLNLSWTSTIGRFYLMMAGALVFGFLNLFLLATVWAFTLAFSTILGISFTLPRAATVSKETPKARVLPMTGPRYIEIKEAV